MKRIALALALLLVSVAAFADFEGAVTPGSVAPRSALVGCINNTNAPVVGNGQQVAVQCDTSGRVITVGSSSGGTSSVTGPTGNNADTVAPTATGQVPSDSYNYGFNGAVWDRLRSGIVANNQSSAGILSVEPMLWDGSSQFNPVRGSATNNDGVGSFPNSNAIQVVAIPYQLNTNGAFDRLRTLGVISTGISAVGISPNPDVVGAILPVTTATAGSQSLVLKNAAGNLYTITADNASQTLSGKLIILNAAVVPVVGVLTSGTVLDCVSIMTGGSQGASVTINHSPGPMARYNAGITALLSTAQNCNTWTPGGISGYISGLVQ